ncbi:MaoC family dehydratase N-terminal domain-containing protein [Parageobacillus thermoglucosidasius]|jgi:acyl dehydratase|uniref:MaoC family dehydratase N-terminal domain-containing protein n=2 Tax=Parageobacillus thermoglucosidasius TaxID=1426 RepID=A0AB38QUR0_PARTM|nr:MaoC family dehydratase N-terminal domain-containing protein [Parageobacillus thermoglucosidasius]ALF10942.1 dehydratase [Parageobacillus thermoglucosidasius]ANZ31018.1 dehydratase [Parageobacillus thermoglucosidasius]APM81755.1 dehydratase [Parageobacillus thermoglucosidasius]KJX69210.1 dehydratase [Parageobacillus thermoglucosidasius]MBY6269136.1 MaoC family dehydratase [Parageobacillus thermoglucosidasius]
MFAEYIGKCSNKVKNVVERGAVKKFAEAIGDPHPIYWDEETGKMSRYKTNIAPPTFPRVFDYGVIEGLKLPSKGLIHGEQRFHYERPLYVGEELYCYSKVEDYYEKQSSMGKLGFLIITNYGEDPSGNVIFTSTSTIIITEAVRKAMIV